MCKCCGCGGNRDCCSPIVPPSDKAKNYRIALFVVLAFHVIVFGVKTYFMGLFSGLTDLAAIIILIIGIIRFDYCLLIVYILLNLFEVFALIVVLGYYLQTDMGKNVPKKEGEKGGK